MTDRFFPYGGAAGAGVFGQGLQNVHQYDPDPVSVAKTRLAHIESQLASVESLQREAAKLRRIIAAAEEPT